MEAKTYRVKSISEAIEKIREELGPDASVLHTRRLKNGLWNWLNGSRYEVVASTEIEVPNRFQQWLSESIDDTQDLIQDELNNEAEEFGSDDYGSYDGHDHFPLDPADESGLNQESDNRLSDSFLFQQPSEQRLSLTDPRSLVSRENESFEEFLGLPNTGGAPTHFDSTWENDPEQTALNSGSRSSTSGFRAQTGSNANADCDHQNGWEQLFAWLRSNGADTKAADMLCNDLKRWYSLTQHDSPSMVPCPDWDDLVSLLGSQLKRGGTIQNRMGHCQRVAFVGPTGVGKTTTLAKLAGEYKLRRGLKVGMITVDTFRVAAVDQLKAYAEIMKIPLEVVSNAEEMREAVAKMDQFDLVLIDTIGRSPSDVNRISQLQETLRAADLDQLYLTLSAGSSLSSLQRSYEAYQSLTSATHSSLILTKIDECASLAGVYPFLKDCPMTWSYWTNGQDVPDDLGVTKDNVALWFIDQIPNSK